MLRSYLPREPFKWKKVIQYFLQGLLIIAPLAITFYAIYWVISTVDGWVPIFREAVRDGQGNILRYEVKNYGLGFLVILAAIIIIGYLSSFFIQSKVFNLFDRWLEKTPGIKFIYTSTRDFFEAFAGDRKKFNKAVLANVFAEDVWIVGFLTDEEMHKFELGSDKVAVYVPQAYNFAGQLYILPREKVKKIDRISSGEAMKYAVTGGVVDLTVEKKPELKNVNESTNSY
ncbi:MAG TPA: DUF502 domain-containing protein [Chitinophagaceae bacterium]|nr:DUF502 domain-containing protein [Chitinophagaceae bacterium]